MKVSFKGESCRHGYMAVIYANAYYSGTTSLLQTALNSATKSMSIDLKDRCIFAVGINPGWVQTDQGGSNAPLTPVESVKGILNVMDELTLEKNGQCLQYDGQIVPL
jgi:NAD(P)-dependent dehydrogenase (short-subunit alcohol dehydrogenase family)